MIVWRGLGMLALFIPAAGASGFGALFSLFGRSGLGAGLGLAAGGVVCYFLGQWLNVTRPESQLAARMNARVAALHAAADGGVFSLGPGYAPPTSMAEAHAQADQLARAEYEALKKSTRNQNSIFWVPMQYWGLAMAGAGILLGLFTFFTGQF
ncbi:MAG: hypothetical protein LBI84_05370 [Propionibacteriaceae bacterium]|jgi:hypothetical protein|nr:hypothetical protein [Propionibacteriaceae bacterium]